MEEGSKRRLVGTAVVVVLLVIFLPMLLEEESPSPVPESDLQVPPSPDLEADIDPTLTEPPPGTFAIPSPPQLPPPETPALSAQIEPPATEEEYEEPPAPAEPESTAPVPAPIEIPAATTAPEEEALPERRAGDLRSWVIQVAALTEAARAESLERDLRAKGFPAFVEQAVVRGKTYHRIRVGPEIEREEIEAMASSLREKTGLQGQILRYP